MRRIINVLLVIGCSLMPAAAAYGQTYYDYAPPITHTGQGFWYQDALNDYQTQYTTYRDYQNRVQSEQERFYRSHKNVELSVSDNRDPAHAGDAVTYYITVGNPASSVASLDITAYLDPHTDFREASDGGQRVNDRVNWNSVVVHPHTKRTLAVTARVDSDVAHDQDLIFRVLSDNTSATEQTRIENLHRLAPLGPTVLAHPQVPRDTPYEVVISSDYEYDQRYARPLHPEDNRADNDFQVTMRARPDGQDVVYTVTVENHTSRTFQDVDVTHLFNIGVDRMEILSSGGGADKGDRIQWNLGHLYPYEYRILTSRVRFLDVPGVHSVVNAYSRDPALRATMGDTTHIVRGAQPYAYNYDAVHFPRAGVKDFFAPPQDTDDMLRPVHKESGAMNFLASVAGTFGTILGMVALRRFF